MLHAGWAAVQQGAACRACRQQHCAQTTAPLCVLLFRCALLQVGGQDRARGARAYAAKVIPPSLAANVTMHMAM